MRKSTLDTSCGVCGCIAIPDMRICPECLYSDIELAPDPFPPGGYTLTLVQDSSEDHQNG